MKPVSRHQQPCPPCSGNCDQGRACPNSIPPEEDDPMEQFDGLGAWEFFAATWPVWLVFAVAFGAMAWRAWPWL
jgi:hypothetical protein